MGSFLLAVATQLQAKTSRHIQIEGITMGIRSATVRCVFLLLAGISSYVPAQITIETGATCDKKGTASAADEHSLSLFKDFEFFSKGTASYDHVEGPFCASCFNPHDKDALDKAFIMFKALRQKLDESQPRSKEFIETTTGVLIHQSCIDQFGRENMVRAVNDAATTLGRCFASTEGLMDAGPKNAARYQHLPRLLRLLWPDKYGEREKTPVCMRHNTCASQEIFSPFEKVDPAGVSCSSDPCGLARKNGCGANQCTAFNDAASDQPKIICQSVENHDYADDTLGFSTAHAGQSFSVRNHGRLAYYAHPVIALNLNAKEKFKDKVFLTGAIGHELMHAMGYPHDHSIMPEYAIGCTAACFPGLAIKITHMDDKTILGREMCIRPIDRPYNVDPKTQTLEQREELDTLLNLSGYTLGQFKKFPN